MVTEEEFVRIWQTAKNTSEAAKAAGLAQQSARDRAVRLRKLGIPLKKFSKGRIKRGDIPGLIALAKSLSQESANGNGMARGVADERASSASRAVSA